MLGALLLDPETIFKVHGRLQPGDFYDPIHREIYEAIAMLHAEGKPIDLSTVAAKLEGHEKIRNIGGAVFLADLAASVPTASHIATYVETVIEKARLRSLIVAGQAISAIGFSEEGTFSDKLHEAESKLFAISKVSQNSKPQSIGALLDKRYAEVAELQQSGDSSAPGGNRMQTI